jgi:hypothetical protein
LFLTNFPLLKHLFLSGKSLAEEGMFDLTKLWCQGDEKPPWAARLDTFTLDYVVFSKQAFELIVQLPVDLHMANAVFRDDSFRMFEKPIRPFHRPAGHRSKLLKNVLHSAKVSGLIIIAYEESGCYDRIWVVGSDFATAEAVKPRSLIWVTSITARLR